MKRVKCRPPPGTGAAAPMSAQQLLHVLFDRFNFDDRDKDGVALEFDIAFRNEADSGKGAFTEPVGEETEPPAQQDDIGGGEHERQFLRRFVSVRIGTGVWGERESNQLAGVESLTMVFILMKLDEDGGGVEGFVAFIQEEG